MKKLLSFLLSIALTMSFCLSFVFTVSAEVLTDSETSADGFGSFDKKRLLFRLQKKLKSAGIWAIPLTLWMEQVSVPKHLGEIRKLRRK